jgi:hypothetical protein
MVAAHSEISWWIHANITSDRESQLLVLPKCDDVSLFSIRPWQTYWLQLKERVLPSVLNHQATLCIFNFYRILLSLVVSKETYLKCTQNPHTRALARNETGCDRLELGLQMVGVCLASNLLFYLAQYSVGQLQLVVLYYQRWLQRLDEELLPTISDRRRYDEEFQTVSVALVRRTIYRYWYSSIGAGFGSMVWPGMGTIYGIGRGDAWAQQMTTTTSPADTGGGASSGLKRILESAPMIFPASFTSPRKTKHSDDDDGSETHDTLLCGCCQIATFSSHERDRTPIASSACGHSICQSCVQKSHLVLCERTSNYEEWVKCPLCNAPKAFHSYNHVVNRSLCDVLLWVEDKMEKG